MTPLKDRLDPYTVKDADPATIRERASAELHVSPGGAHWIRWADGRETGPFWIDDDGNAHAFSS